MTRTKICSHFFPCLSGNLLFIFFFPPLIPDILLPVHPPRFTHTFCMWPFFPFYLVFICARIEKKKLNNSAELCRKYRMKCTHKIYKSIGILSALNDDLEFFASSFVSYLGEHACASENIKYKCTISLRAKEEEKKIVKILLSLYLRTYYDVQKRSAIYSIAMDAIEIPIWKEQIKKLLFSERFWWNNGWNEDAGAQRW